MLRATVVILLLNLLSRLLGFIRDATIAWQYGGGAVTEAYLVAYSLPYALQAVLGMSFVTVMVPTLTGYLVQDKKAEGALVVSSVINGIGLVLLALTAAGLAAAPGLVHIMAPGFSGEELQLTVRLTRIMFPSIIFMGLGLMLTGILNSHKKFALPALAPAVANLAVIGAVVFFGSGQRADPLAVGTLIGFIGFLLIQLPALPGLAVRMQRVLHWRHPQVKRAVWAILPVTFATAVNQLALAMNRFFASDLSQGSITALDYAHRVMDIPLGIFAAAVATAAFPAMAEQGAKGDWLGFRDNFYRSLRFVSFTMLPAAAGLLVLRQPVIRFLFERGKFTAANTALTAEALLYFCLGLWFLGAIFLLTRAYYALGDLKTPALVGLAAIVSNLIFSLLLLPVMGHGGLALANTLAAGVNAGLLFYLLGRRVAAWNYVLLARPLGQMALAALIMGVLVRGGLQWAPITSSFAGQGLVLIGLVAAGGAIYALAVTLLGVEEARELRRIFQR